MSVTDESIALTEAWRRSQVELRAQVSTEAIFAMQALNVEDIAGTWPAIERMMVRLIKSERRRSEAQSLGFYDQVRRAEGVTGMYEQRLADPLDINKLVTNLRIVGPGQAGKAVALGQSNVLVNTAARVAAEAGRNVSNGGRFSTINTAVADKKVIGWLRVTDGNPCAFCRLLASRGPVYRSEASALETRRKFSKAKGKPDGRSRGKPGATAPPIWSDRAKGFRAHPNCGCTARPIYSTNDRLLKQSDKFFGEYEAAVLAYPDVDPLNAYRAWLRAQTRA